MSAPSSNRGRSWEEIGTAYADLATHVGFEYQKTMVAIAGSLANHAFGARLFPFMSHESLCIALHEHYDPQLPFFSVTLKPDGVLEFALWRAVGDLAESTRHTVADVLPVFDSFLERLRRHGANT